MKEISEKEYIEAYEIVERYKAQFKKTIQVTVGYNAKVYSTLQIPMDWSNDKIKKELAKGSYGLEEESENTNLGEMFELYINGVEIKL